MRESLSFVPKCGPCYKPSTACCSAHDSSVKPLEKAYSAKLVQALHRASSVTLTLSFRSHSGGTIDR